MSESEQISMNTQGRNESDAEEGPRLSALQMLIVFCLLFFGISCGITAIALEYWYYVDITEAQGRNDNPANSTNATEAEYLMPMTLTSDGVNGTNSTGNTNASITAAYFGLWQLCHRNDDDHTCVPWNDANDTLGLSVDLGWLHGCQATMIIGAGLNAAALCGALLATSKRRQMRIIQAIAAASGVFYLVAVVIFGVKYRDYVTSILLELRPLTGGALNAGFALAVAASVINIIPLCVMAIAHARGRSGYRQI